MQRRNRFSKPSSRCEPFRRCTLRDCRSATTATNNPHLAAYLFSEVFDLKPTSMLQLQQTYRRTSEIGQTARCIEATSFTSSDPAMRERAHCLATRPPAMSPKCSGFAHPHSMGIRGSLFSARKNRKTRLIYPSFVWYKTVSVVELVALRRVAPRAAAQ